jgi:hypothetical protein
MKRAKICLIRIFRSLFSLELVYLLIFFSIHWLAAIFLSNYFRFSKQSYYVKTDEEFMQKYNDGLNNTLKAYEKMKEWLKDNYNQAGLKKSTDYLFNQEPSSLFKSNTNADKLCVCVITKSRRFQQLNYVSQTVISLLTRIKLKHQETVLFKIFNVDNRLSENSDLKLIDNLLKIEHIDISLAKQLLTDINLVNYNDLIQEPKTKEFIDYLIIMRYVYNLNYCKYALLIEDDCITVSNWYEKLMSAIEEISKTYGDDKWMCLKLFISYRYFDWLVHLPTALSMILWVTVTSIGEIFFINFLYNSHKNKHNIEKTKLISFRKYKMNLSVFSTILIVLNLFLLKFWLNSTSVSPLGYGLKRFSQGFNTVSMLYPRSQLLFISEHMSKAFQAYYSSRINKASSTKLMPKDLTLNEYRKANSLVELIIEPPLFQHIGIHSSLGSRSDLKGVALIQYRPFQSYSFIKENSPYKIEFSSDFWLS